MKDYIDKLREDYHRKQIKKLKFGDKFKAKLNDWRYGTFESPEIEVGADGKEIPKVATSPTVTTNTGTLNNLGNLNNNQYGLQQTFTPKNTSTSSVDFGFGPDISGTIGKTSAIDLTPQQKLINVMSSKDITNTADKQTSDQIASKELEKIVEKEGINPYKIQENQVIKDSELKQEEPKKEEQKLTVEQPSPGFFIPPNGDLTTNLYNLGRAIGQKKGTPGRGLGIAGNAGAAALEGARALFSGVGFSKAQAYTDQFNQQQMIEARKKYESNPQYKNTNYTGGVSQRLGGKIGYFAEGGEQQMDPRMEQMMAQQQQADPRMQQQMDPRMAQQQQMDPRMQQQQETQMNEQEAQAYQKIAEKLVSSFETIEEIADYLNENGVDEVAFNAIIKFAQDMMEDRDESAEDNEEAIEEPEEEEMRKGGKKFNKKVGEYIEFEYDGKVHKGIIKSIKNGQIFLK